MRSRRQVDLNDTPEQASYRQEVRAWLEANKAQAPPRSGSSEDRRTSTRGGPGSASWPRPAWPG